MPRRKSARSDPDPRWTSELAPAPGELRIVQAFLNTVDRYRKTELAGPEALGRWLAHWSLAPADLELTQADLDRAIELREALRALLRAHRGAAVSDAVIARLDDAARPATLRVRFGEGGNARCEPAAEGLDGVIARLCTIVLAAQADGSWKRLKVCGAKVCDAAYYDFSPNRSAKYCGAKCSSRASSLVYRGRNLDEIRRTDARTSRARRFRRYLQTKSPIGPRGFGD